MVVQICGEKVTHTGFEGKSTQR